MNCEDTSKLRTPLNAVCQTTDIGCVPITNGRPTCSPQPDELPLAYDKSTTTLWIYACDTKSWVPFQKFSVCQLQSVNLENITNICDILQIAVNYNPGTGCKQGTISLGELAEQLLKCIRLQTKVINLTSSGDKIKIFVQGLEESLPPLFVKGRNIWSEGGTGTEADPVKIATHDPICQWPIRTRAQVNAATTKHVGACLDGTMVRAPYPETPCEFPQMTIEEVHAAEDKDMIVCVNGENAKVPIYDGLLTPICENPQISVAQAKAKPKLRIVSCEDGKIVLFPLPKEMFQGHYMCVPFIDGVPSGPPVDGTGPIRFDCNNDIWFWVCEENRWHRIDVGNHYHPPWKQVYDFIANRCENIKFHGWSEQDDCYTDFEMTPQELADFILCECLDPITPVQANAAIGRGEEVKFPICVDGTARKIDWSLCSWPYISPANINAAINRGEEANLGICVDGKNYKTNWNVCAYPELNQTELNALSNIFLTVCAEEGDNYENRIVNVQRVINNYAGIDFYSAGTHHSGDGDFEGTVTPDGDGNAVYISTSTSPIVGGGTLAHNPFGSPDITIKNETKVLKFYSVFHVIRLFRHQNYVSKCSFGVTSAITSTPSFCTIGAYNSEHFSEYPSGSDGSDLSFLTDAQCSGSNPSDVLINTTETFNLQNFDEDLTRATASLILPKNGGYAQYNSDGFWQKGSTMQFTFFYLLPGQSATLTMRSMSVVSGLESSAFLKVRGSTRFFVIGYSASILNSKKEN